MKAPLGFLGKGKWLVETVGDNSGQLQRTIRTVTAKDTLTVPRPPTAGSPRWPAPPPRAAPTARNR